MELDVKRRSRLSVLFIMAFLLILNSHENAVCADSDNQSLVRIDRRVTIVPPGSLTRAMMSMIRHPDGAIYR